MKRTKLFLLLLTLLCVLCVSAQAEEYTVPSGSFSTKVEYLKNVFPEGWYWNEWTSSELGSATQKTITINGYTTTISTKPCTKHTSVQTSCNSFNSGSQCTGWARMLFTLVWGITPYDNGYMLCYLPETDDAYLLDYVKPGDIIWYGTHSMFVIAVDGDTLTVSDCNSRYTCGIQWSRTITKTKIHSNMKSNGKGRIWSPTPFSISSSNWESWEVVYSGGLNIRCQPFTGSTKIVGGVACGEIFRIDREHVTTTGDGTWAWCKTSDGESGWIRIDDYSLCVPYDTDACTHSNSMGSVTKEPTCTEEGVYTSTCCDCGAVLDTQALPPEHGSCTWSPVKGTTCTEDGVYKVVCNDCGELLELVTDPAPGHDEGEWVVTQEPTCTGYGFKTRNCTRCGEVLETLTLGTTDHNWSEWVTLTEPTCIDPGEEARYCGNCGVIDTMPLWPLDHTAGDWVTIPPTCTEYGYDVQCCTVCGEQIDSKNRTDFLGHTYGTLDTTKEATCTEEGEFDLFCTVCGEYLESGTLPATGHTEGEWVVITEATANADGLKRQSCTVCGETLAEETIPATGDTPQSNITMSAGQNLSVVPGETVTVPISISNPGGVSIAQITLELELPAGVTMNVDSVSVCGMASNFSLTKNVATIIMSSSDGSALNGHILNIPFTFTSTVQLPANIVIHPQVISINEYDEDLWNLPSVTASVEEALKRIPGDVTNDGVVDGRDSVRLLRYLAHWNVTIHESNSDVTGDGLIDGRDSVRLLRYLAHWDVVLK